MNVVSYAANPNTQIFLDAATINYVFDVTINNVADSITGNHIPAPPTSPANAFNYKFQIQFSNADLGNGGTDTVGLAPVDCSTQKSETLIAQDVAQAYTSLTATMQLPPPASPDLCTAIKYACVIVVEGDHAQYKDVNTTNNKKCIDIHTSMKNCRPGESDRHEHFPML